MVNKADLPFVAMVLGVGIIALAMVTLTILSVNAARETPLSLIRGGAVSKSSKRDDNPGITDEVKTEDMFCDPCVTKTEEVRPTKPHIINHILIEADKWYEIKLPEDVVTWQMMARGDYDLEYSFEPSQSTTMVLPSGSILNENTAPNMSIKSIYVRSETANSQVDIEMWRNLG